MIVKLARTSAFRIVLPPSTEALRPFFIGQFHLKGQWNFLIRLLLRSVAASQRNPLRFRQSRTAPLHTAGLSLQRAVFVDCSARQMWVITSLCYATDWITKV